MVDKPDWTPDFADVHATTPIYDEGEYEVGVERVRGRQYQKDDGTVVKLVYLTPEMKGKIDSNGKVEEFDMTGESASDIRLYLHSRGALQMSKRVVMAFAGYGPKEEDKFNKWFAKQDFSFHAEEDEDGDFEVSLGDGWEKLEGNRARVRMSKGSYTPADGDGNPTGEPVETQEFNGWSVAK